MIGLPTSSVSSIASSSPWARIEFGPFQHDLLLFQRILPAPDAALKGRARGSDRAVDIGRIAARQVRPGSAVHRTDAGEGRAGRRGAKAPSMKWRPSSLSADKNAFPIVARVMSWSSQTAFRQRHDGGGETVDIGVRHVADGRAAHRLVFRRAHLSCEIGRQRMASNAVGRARTIPQRSIQSETKAGSAAALVEAAGPGRSIEIVRIRLDQPGAASLQSRARWRVHGEPAQDPPAHG